MSTKIIKPLKEIFTDPNYAWELLEAEVKLETSESQSILGEDISYLLQLYMRGVERMNSLQDIRESFFKNRVTALMGKPTVIKILSKPMTKKTQPAVANCSTPVNQSKNSEDKKQLESPSKALDPKTQLQLKQKKQNLEMRLAYSAEQNNSDALKKLMAEHTKKQTFLNEKIDRIFDTHQQRLRKRISERKLKTLTAKSRSQVFNENPGMEVGYFDVNQCDPNFNGININIQGAHEEDNYAKQAKQQQNHHQNSNSSHGKKIEQKKNHKSMAKQSFSIKARRKCRSLQTKSSYLYDEEDELKIPKNQGKRKISAEICQLNSMKDVQEKFEKMKQYIQEKKKLAMQKMEEQPPQ